MAHTTSPGIAWVHHQGVDFVTALLELGDFVTDFALGAINDDDGGSNRGAIWLAFANFRTPAPGGHRG